MRTLQYNLELYRLAGPIYDQRRSYFSLCNKSSNVVLQPTQNDALSHYAITYNIFIIGMSTVKIQEENSREIYTKERIFSVTKNPLRETSYVIRKAHFQGKNVLQNRTISHENSLKPYEESNSTEIIEYSCSNFMKNFVDKLKKQRKREKKKIVTSNHNKGVEKNALFSCDIAPLPLIQHGKQQILILERIKPAMFKTDQISPVPSVGTIHSDSMVQILKDIQQIKGKLQRNSPLRKRVSLPLPVIDIKQTLSRKGLNMESVDPWQGNFGNSDNAFEQYK